MIHTCFIPYLIATCQHCFDTRRLPYWTAANMAMVFTAEPSWSCHRGAASGAAAAAGRAGADMVEKLRDEATRRCNFDIRLDFGHGPPTAFSAWGHLTIGDRRLVRRRHVFEAAKRSRVSTWFDPVRIEDNVLITSPRRVPAVEAIVFFRGPER